MFCFGLFQVLPVGRCRGLHFLAIQEGEDAESCAGMWLLQDRPPPTI
jgi:RNA-binding protein Tab2/Atab2